MSDRKVPKLDTQQTIVIVALIAGVVAVMIYAPSELHAPLAALVTGAAAFLRSPVSR